MGLGKTDLREEGETVLECYVCGIFKKPVVVVEQEEEGVKEH